MKKLVLVVILLFICTQEYQRVDLKRFQQDRITIEVKGEVENPGMITVDRDAVVGDVLKQVKVKETADLGGLNQSSRLENGFVIVVPKQAKQELISINGADLATLDKLPGVGPSIATRIIDYRSDKPFQSLEQLTEVKGIGDKLFLKIKPFICL